MRGLGWLAMGIASVLLMSGTEAQSSPVRFTVLPGESRVEFVSGTQLGDFRGETQQLSGEMVVDPEVGAPVRLTVAVDLRTLKTDNAIRDRHMHENVLEDSRFPRAIFTASDFRPAPGARKEGGEGSLSGVLTLHGVERPVSLPIRFRMNGTAVHGEGTLTVKLTDFKMTPPHLLGLKVRDQVTVQIHFVAAGG